MESMQPTCIVHILDCFNAEKSNGQSKMDDQKTWVILGTTHRTKTNKSNNTTQKDKLRSKMESAKYPELMCLRRISEFTLELLTLREHMSSPWNCLPFVNTWVHPGTAYPTGTHVFTLELLTLREHMSSLLGQQFQGELMCSRRGSRYRGNSCVPEG
jgi:hypothetical protein